MKGILILEVLVLHCGENMSARVWEMALMGVWELANLPYLYYTFTKAKYL